MSLLKTDDQTCKNVARAGGPVHLSPVLGIGDEGQGEGLGSRKRVNVYADVMVQAAGVPGGEEAGLVWVAWQGFSEVSFVVIHQQPVPARPRLLDEG